MSLDGHNKRLDEIALKKKRKKLVNDILTKVRNDAVDVEEIRSSLGNKYSVKATEDGVVIRSKRPTK